MTDRALAPRVVLSGYYGFANAGDEAILQATVDGIRRHCPDADAVVLSADPAATTRRTGATAGHRYQFRELWRRLHGPGLLVSGGGGLFQDSTSRQSIYYYLGVLLWAHLRGMKTMVYAQGLGPLHRSSSRKAVRAVLRRVDAITFRDEESAKLLAKIGLGERAAVTADPAFALELSSPTRAREILAEQGIPLERDLLAVSVRPWPEFGDRSQQALAAALKQAVQGRGVSLLFIPVHHHDDLAPARELASTCGGSVLEGACTPAELGAVLGLARGLVAMRLHALILASLSGVPAAALSYDPKVDAIARRLHLPALDVRQLNEDALDAAIQSALDTAPAQRQRIAAAAAAQRSLAEDNFRILAELLQKT